MTRGTPIPSRMCLSHIPMSIAHLKAWVLNTDANSHICLSFTDLVKVRKKGNR